MKTTAIGIITGTEYSTHAIITVIEQNVNDILKRSNGKLDRIEIATSIHQQDYDALTIRVIGWGDAI